jgi:hypothetical protein
MQELVKTRVAQHDVVKQSAAADAPKFSILRRFLCSVFLLADGFCFLQNA